MMRKFISKKGVTLVELVVTVAIMSITAGMGVGIFASTMNNYSSASVLATEQQKVTEIENYIYDNASVCESLYFIDSTVSGGGATNFLTPGGVDSLILSTTDEVDYMMIDPDSTNMRYKTNVKDASGNLIPEAELNVSGVDNIVFSISKQKIGRSESDPTRGGLFFYLNYEINMVDGYSVSGSVVMEGCGNVRTALSNDFVEDGNYGGAGGTFKVGGDSLRTTGIAFQMQPVS